MLRSIWNFTSRCLIVTLPSAMVTEHHEGTSPESAIGQASGVRYIQPSEPLCTAFGACRQPRCHYRNELNYTSGYDSDRMRLWLQDTALGLAVLQ